MIRARRSIARGLRWAAVIVAAASFLVAIGYLAYGWGLAESDLAGEYRLVTYWTQANGQAFSEPFGIAVDRRNGNVLVTDARDARVVVLDETGGLVRRFGSKGSGPGEFEKPTGIAVGIDGSIFVADYDLDRIQRFSESGAFLLGWGGPGSGPEEFRNPNGLAVDADGNVYVSDFLNKVVKVFTSEGTYRRTIGKPGQVGPGYLDYPTDVAVAPEDQLIIADAYNYRLQLFDAQGNHRDSWGWHLFWLWPRPAGRNRGFNVPTGVAYDPMNQQIHVADSGNRRLVMLGGRGAYVTEFRITDTGIGYYTPTTVAVSPTGKRVYATDIANHRILVLAVEDQRS